MGKERTGRPLDTPFPLHPSSGDKERREPHIPSGFLITRMFSTIIQEVIHTVTGVNEYAKYGRSTYGRCRYGARYGIYGCDRYGSCRYN